MNNIIIDKRNLLAYKIESGNHYKSIPCTMVLRLMDTDEYANNYCKALALGLPVNELNAHYRAEYQAVQDALMKCLQILTTESHQLKEQAGQ